MRGIYNGEIKDRPHVFQLLFFVVFAGILLAIPVMGANNAWKEGDVTKCIILLGVIVMVSWFAIIAIGKEFIFLTINKENIIIKRPLLKISPFPKDKTLVVLPVKDIAEIKIYFPPTLSFRRNSSRRWKFISHDGKELLKMAFEPEFIFNTVELQDYFNQNGMNIRVT
jgi:hypothetical protein